MSPVVQVRDLHVWKGGRVICRVPELRVQPAERLVVVGPNGSGKTTLLRTLGGLELEVAGALRVAPPVRSRVLVHQAPYLFRGSVLFNARYGLGGRGLTRGCQLSRARRWLSHFGVAHLEHRRCGRLSGGERRRIALARAFAVEPSLMLLDEPLADLDDDGIERVFRAIDAVERTTVVIASPARLPDGFAARTVHLA